MQLFVVDKLDKKSGTVAAIYVFDNHDAANLSGHKGVFWCKTTNR